MVRSNSYVTPDCFVRAWQQSQSVAEVCERISSTRSAVMVRWRKYRDLGVNLKPLSNPNLSNRGRKPTVDVAALNKLISEMESGRKPARR